MCYNCGCHIPQDNMGDDDNITDQTFEKAAKAWGQSVTEAKQQTYDLLGEELRKLKGKDQKAKSG